MSVVYKSIQEYAINLESSDVEQFYRDIFGWVPKLLDDSDRITDRFAVCFGCLFQSYDVVATSDMMFMGPLHLMNYLNDTVVRHRLPARTSTSMLACTCLCLDIE